jgi:hypothetical protein
MRLKVNLDKSAVPAAKRYFGRIVPELQIEDLEESSTAKYCIPSNDEIGMINPEYRFELLDIFMWEAHSIAFVWLTCSGD